MAIEWPSALCPSSQNWGMEYNNRAFTSTLSNAQQIVGYPGSYWSCSMTFSALTRAEERLFTSFLGELQGMFGTFKLPAFTRTRSDDIGSPVVGTANAQAATMTVSGLSPNVQAFEPGDYITINDEMFEVIRSVKANPSGTATLYLNKRIRANIPAGTAIEYKAPYSVMRLTEDSYQLTRQAVISNSTIQCREAF